MTTRPSAGPLAVTCPACPDLDLTATDETTATAVAGTHDDDRHDGQPTATTTARTADTEGA